MASEVDSPDKLPSQRREIPAPSSAIVEVDEEMVAPSPEPLRRYSVRNWPEDKLVIQKSDNWGWIFVLLLLIITNGACLYLIFRKHNNDIEVLNLDLTNKVTDINQSI